MQTQRVAKRSPVRYLLPPLSLKIDILEEQQKKIVIDVRAYSGTHCFAHRQLQTFLDAFGDVPVIVGSSLLSWTLWLVQFSDQRRAESQGRLVQPRLPFPGWPSPLGPYGSVKDPE